MVNPDVIKEQYQRMPDEQLIGLAQHESEGLTQESFHLLKAELERRGIDLSVIQNMQAERDQMEARKVSAFERTTAFEFTNSIWEFAFDEKEKGVANGELFHSLLAKNIAPEFAYMLINSIGPKAKKIVEDLKNEIIIGWVFAIVGFLILLFKISSFGVFVVWALVLLVGGIIRLAKSYKKKERFEKILKHLDNQEINGNNPTSLYQ